MNNTILTQDGTPLKKSLKIALFRHKLRAFLLIAPLLVFFLVAYILPIFSVLYKSVNNDVVYEIIPQTAEMLVKWEPDPNIGLPEAIYASFAREMLVAVKQRDHGRIGVHLNKDIGGLASKFRRLGRQIKKWDFDDGQSFKNKFIQADKIWGDVNLWMEIKLYSSRFTFGNFARALDGRLTSSGFELRPQSERFLIKLFNRTLQLSILITFAALVLGYPIAWLMSNVKTKTANLLLILVLLPFWTSLLVRTASWRVLLQDTGVLNSSLLWINEAVPFLFRGAPYDLMYNQLSVVIAMTHILLPFMILPIYSVMKTISPSYVKAARSLGANDWTTFWRVYFPLTLSGVGAGATLVFILSVGYYITPAIVGGTDGIFISNSIANYIKTNQGLGAALASILFVCVLFLYFVYDKVIGLDKTKLN
ncbi:ABC transporter permease [Alphaproteobacteria bacterium]|nr:ABC transporter permease [Alphaproteobacteria bacterium]